MEKQQLLGPSPGTNPCEILGGARVWEGRGCSCARVTQSLLGLWLCHHCPQAERSINA